MRLAQTWLPLEVDIRYNCFRAAQLHNCLLRTDVGIRLSV